MMKARILSLKMDYLFMAKTREREYKSTNVEAPVTV